MTVYIGTSGFSYQEWKGNFYPEKLKKEDYLAYYSTVFNALEINSSFYGIPSGEQLISFYERSDGRLMFSLKVYRKLTHEVQSDWRLTAEAFKNSIAVLREKGVLGSLLFQFPPTFDYSVSNRKYLSELLKEFDGFSCVIEFRNVNWLKESAFDGLVKRNASLAFADMPQLRKNFDGSAETRFVGSNAYIRFHMKNMSAWYCQEEKPFYTPSELGLFLPVINQAEKENRDVYLFFYNHSGGTGAMAARRLREML